MKRGYQLPFYADLSRMPEMERKVIWGMMVGEEAKTKIPIYQNYKEGASIPKKHMLQSYGDWLAVRQLPGSGAAVLRSSRGNPSRLGF